MSKFYLFLWLKWAFRLTISTIIYGAVFAFVITGYLYVKQGLPTLNSELYKALFSIWNFWFLIVANLALLLALFRGMKYIFNNCNSGYVLELLTCNQKEIIENIGYGDLVKVWRRWFMLIVWLTGAEMLISLLLTLMFIPQESIFSWFNIYLLYGFIILSGYFSFYILIAKCKQVRIRKC